MIVVISAALKLRAYLDIGDNGHRRVPFVG